LNRKSSAGAVGVERAMKTTMTAEKTDRKPDQFYTVKQLADRLAVTPITTYRL
jgi:HPt (histidine-containing phosphotransfer) domain-containing protein